MSDDAIRVSGPINAAGLEMTLETGRLASPCRRRGHRAGRRHDGAVDGLHVEAA